LKGGGESAWVGAVVVGPPPRCREDLQQRSFVAEDEGARPSEAELLEQLEAELKKLKIADVLVQTVFTVSSLGYRRLGEEDRDLDQARLAIEALRALVPVLKGAVSEQITRDFEQMVANMQLAYAKAVAES
jgi:hypothetical protein